MNIKPKPNLTEAAAAEEKLGGGRGGGGGAEEEDGGVSGLQKSRSVGHGFKIVAEDVGKILPWLRY